MRPFFTMLLFLLVCCSSSFAQSSPNNFDITLDKKAKEVYAAACGENGFCVVTETQSRKIHQAKIIHADTSMHALWDTTLNLSQDWLLQQVFYEDNTLVILCRWRQNKRFTDKMTIFLYNLISKKWESRDIAGLPAIDALTNWHHYRGNLFFTSLSQYGDNVWYLPAGFSEPFPFTFTRENRGKLLTTAVDTAQGCAIICFNSGGRTMYFETDFSGKSSFANMINEAASGAHWTSVGRNHSMLMLYHQDDDSFYMHPVNILNHLVMPSETVYYADIAVPKTLPNKSQKAELIIVAPHNYTRFYPTQVTLVNGRLACVTELYYPEYSNYFNGWYLESRFDGYRYERADVHFFDTNGVFLTNVSFPYAETVSLRTTVYRVLNVSGFENGDVLLYTLGGYEFSTMLLDSLCRLKSPVSTMDIPIRRASAAGQYKVVPVAMQPWYDNRFLLTAYKVQLGSQRKLGYLVKKLEYY